MLCLKHNVVRRKRKRQGCTAQKSELGMRQNIHFQLNPLTKANTSGNQPSVNHKHYPCISDSEYHCHVEYHCHFRLKFFFVRRVDAVFKGTFFSFAAAPCAIKPFHLCHVLAVRLACSCWTENTWHRLINCF